MADFVKRLLVIIDSGITLENGGFTVCDVETLGGAFHDAVLLLTHGGLIERCRHFFTFEPICPVFGRYTATYRLVIQGHLSASHDRCWFSLSNILFLNAIEVLDDITADRL